VETHNDFMLNADLIYSYNGDSIDNDDDLRIFESETVTVKRGHVVFGNIWITKRIDFLQL
jgi:hypothetical protein